MEIPDLKYLVNEINERKVFNSYRHIADPSGYGDIDFRNGELVLKNGDFITQIFRSEGLYDLKLWKELLDDKKKPTPLDEDALALLLNGVLKKEDSRYLRFLLYNFRRDHRRDALVLQREFWDGVDTNELNSFDHIFTFIDGTGHTIEEFLYFVGVERIRDNFNEPIIGLEQWCIMSSGLLGDAPDARKFFLGRDLLDRCFREDLDFSSGIYSASQDLYERIRRKICLPEDLEKELGSFQSTHSDYSHMVILSLLLFMDLKKEAENSAVPLQWYLNLKGSYFSDPILFRETENMLQAIKAGDSYNVDLWSN